MKRVFFFGVIAYSIAIFLFNDLPAAVNVTGTAALPWMAKCLVDMAFVALGFFAMYGDKIDWDEEDEGIHPDDVKVPSVWLYGLFGINLMANFGWHGFQFATQSGPLALYNAMWFFVEAAAMFLTFVLFKHAQQAIRREVRKAQMNRASNRTSNRDTTMDRAIRDAERS